MRKYLFIIIFIISSVALCSISWAAVSIKGIAIDEQGKPVSGARISLLASVESEAGKIIGSAVSGADGSFRIAYTKPKPSIFLRSMHLTASGGDRLGFITVLNPQASQRVVCSVKGSILGVVKDANDQPVEGVTVTPSAFVRNAFLGQRYIDYQSIKPAVEITSSVTDKRGMFAITGLPIGYQTFLTAYKGGLLIQRPKDWTGNWSSTLSAYPEPDSETRAVRITFVTDTKPAAAGKISGNLYDASDKPMPGVSIAAIKMEKNSPVRGEKPSYAMTASDGSYLFDALAPGIYTLTIFEASQPVPPETDVKVVKDEITEVELYAVPGVPVQGKVVDKSTGKGLVGITVASPESKPVITGTDGSFSINIIPGAGMVVANGESAGYYPQGVEVTAPEGGKVAGTIIKLMPVRKLFGQVQDSSGKPVNGAWIQSMWPNKPGDILQSDALGRYDIILNDQPSMTLMASDPEMRNMAIKTVKLSGKTEKLDIKLMPASSIRGTIKDQNGNKISGAVITPYISLANYRIANIENKTVSDEFGNFAVNGIIPGAVYTIRINADGYEDFFSSPNQMPKLVSGKTANAEFTLVKIR